MANRDKIQSRGKIEDRRGTSIVGSLGGVSLIGIALVLAIGYFSGPEQAIQVRQDMQENTQLVQQTTTDTGTYAGEDEYELFTSQVLGSLNDLRKGGFQSTNITYQEPTLVLFRGGTQSACGGALSQIGPHYCPLDETIYLDETFFEELREKFGAQDGDITQAYVLAHEVGHHVQHLLGITEQTNRRDNENSIKLELQADCFAGIWLGNINREGIISTDEIYEAMDAAAAVGDDHIQETTAGYVQPESRTHGSSKQRKEWLMRGYTTQSFESCNTFG